MLCCYKVSPENTSSLPLAGSTIEKSSYCGHVVNPCNSVSAKMLFAISLILGCVLLLIGTLALMGYCAPTTGGGTLAPLLEKLNSGLSFIATELGTDPLVLAVFPTAFGIAFIFTGCVGLATNKKPAVIYI